MHFFKYQPKSSEARQSSGIKTTFLFCSFATATTLSKDSVDYRELPPIENFVLVMGNEGQGISPLMAESADQLVHISMKGQAESLNVAVAAGILIFHLS